MAQEEYLEYAEDPTGFLMKKILPRHYRKLAGLGLLDFSMAIWQGGLYATLPAVDPSVREAFDAILSCGQAMNEQVGANARFTLDMIQRGIPSGVDFVTSAPFDIFNDTLRGFLNVSMDMYDCPGRTADRRERSHQGAGALHPQSDPHRYGKNCRLLCCTTVLTLL